MADEGRMEELLRKRGEVGLSEEEANELGRLMAEQRGSPYWNAKSSPPHSGEEPRVRGPGG